MRPARELVVLEHADEQVAVRRHAVELGLAQRTRRAAAAAPLRVGACAITLASIAS